VWNENLRDQLLEIYPYIKPDQVFVTGTPQFDFHFNSNLYVGREEFFASIGADQSKKLVLYTTGMPKHMPGEPEIVESIADILKKLPGAPHLAVRVYAKDRSRRFDELKNRRTDIIFTPVAWDGEGLTPRREDINHFVNLLRHCDVGINVASTVSLELCIFGKPVINIGFNPVSVSENEISYADYYNFDHYAPIVKSGAVTLVHSIEQLSSALVAAIENPERESGLRNKLVSEFFGEYLDGSSAERVADVLKVLASQNDND
jgi:hypothetical protein